jgi:ERCC4-type nuclease
MTTKLDKIEPEVGQVYQIERNDDQYQILYVDEEVVMLRSDDPERRPGNFHRIERRSEFDKQVESGWFKYQPDSDIDMLSSEDLDWTEVDYIGETTAENLHDAGYSTVLDVQQADDDALLDVSGLGEAGLINLREFAQ